MTNDDQRPTIAELEARLIAGGEITLSPTGIIAEDAFRNELSALINRHSMEQASDTPDYILARYLFACLTAFDVTIRARETWYGRTERLSDMTKPVAPEGPKA